MTFLAVCQFDKQKMKHEDIFMSLLFRMNYLDF